ncbi:UDP-N-acetylmuramoylalanine--D-glutamate ligase [Aquimarina sp. EL_43]|uniref:UDP-N-acetylmuramoyl-L-alanine--D-glutamate ligase n=1 Tax=unclassified Aquimarina TaxID=2627091 RepID=UPI0018C993CF|nr:MULTISPECIES: UDP-N-acetylmuramoyl-L-alanine--D-glutamate ligase [unclassified Aquimarina]MBG6131323.1 UDP-N-acetylmuramoylalanine--D-glutamate ligase [Aquimarina sp. EL_35]MBG6151794.1 UDP-N-acetylmuramoylalanine--D-glutamate ligase [Aquimarina sp. EL_32]MBG6169724.1 UDP-N-acetylmuramoylalanine--D-glutamate ligase [Aquimarina sp. EL_43]
MKRLVVLGAGESGVGTAILGKKEGFDVFVSDKGIITDQYKEVLRNFEIEWEEQEHTEIKILNADIVMKSPGIPDKVALIAKLYKKGIPVVSEIEFAAKYTAAQIVGITGSNGKTTTTMLTHYVLQNGGLKANMAGNIGDSFAKQVAENDAPFYVLELSSFQLDGIEDFAPHIAVLTNITPDHLDRYEYQFESYIASKFRIAMNQNENDYFIYDADDTVITEYLKQHPVRSKLLPFSLTKKVENGAYLEEENITIIIDNNKVIMPTTNLALKGNHNVKNAMAAATVSQLLKIRKATIRECLENFHGVEHRLEDVLKINNVQYINDSKATNVNATFYALDAMKSATVWIVGGVDKGNDYTELYSLVNEKVKAIICLGVDNSKIINAFGNCVDNIIETQSMKEAVNMAYKIAERNENVLLSPACASFDLFKNYEERGRQFKEAVREL